MVDVVVLVWRFGYRFGESFDGGVMDGHADLVMREIVAAVTYWRRWWSG